jgi:hypothetical protein
MQVRRLAGIPPREVVLVPILAADINLLRGAVLVVVIALRVGGPPFDPGAIDRPAVGQQKMKIPMLSRKNL